MRSFRVVLLAAAMIALLTAAAPAQEMLRYFPEDTHTFLEIKPAVILNLLPKEILESMGEGGIGEMALRLLGRVDSIFIGMSGDSSGAPDGGTSYALLKGNVNLEQILNELRASGVEVRSIQVGALTAYTAEEEDEDFGYESEFEGEDDYEDEDEYSEEDDYYDEYEDEEGYGADDYDFEEEDAEEYVADVGSGMLIIGSEEAIAKFLEVRAGSEGNAAGNAALKAVLADFPDRGFLRVAGYQSEAMKQTPNPMMPFTSGIDTFAMALDYADENLLFSAVIGAEGSTLNQIKEFAETQLGDFAKMDASGAVAELRNNLVAEIAGSKIRLGTKISRKTIDKFIQQFSSLLGVEQ